MWPYSDKNDKNNPSDFSAARIDDAFNEFLTNGTISHEDELLTRSGAKKIFESLDEALMIYETRAPQEWVLHPSMVRFLHDRAKQIIFLMIGRVHVRSFQILKTGVVLFLGNLCVGAMLYISLNDDSLSSFEKPVAKARLLPNHPGYKESSCVFTVPPTPTRPGSGIWYSLVGVVESYMMYANNCMLSQKTDLA